MKEKGFTLIELLAVIVILAIVALIATPIILNIINDAKQESQERSVELYASAVRNAIAAYQLTGTSAPESFDDLTIQYDGNVECTTEELYSDGSFYIADCTVNGDEVEYTYGTKQETEVAKACTIERQDASKYSIGDVVTCTLTESIDKFYIIADAELTATTIQMLTEKNIHTTEYRQSDNAGTLAFSSTIYWLDESGNLLSQYASKDVYDENSLLYPIVDNYVSYLNTKLTGVTGILLTYSQAENLGCIGDNRSCAPGVNGGGNAPAWVYSTNYLLGSSRDGGYIWFMYSDGDFGNYNSVGYYDYDNGGVRPVITISTSDIQ